MGNAFEDYPTLAACGAELNRALTEINRLREELAAAQEPVRFNMQDGGVMPPISS